MTDIQQAREWAETVKHYDDTYGRGENAAAEVINALPDQWIDAEKVREIYDRYRASETTLHEAFRAAVALATPPLPTLADMTPEERDTQKWMQAQVFPTASTPGIITGVDEYAHSAIILFADGMAKNVPWKDITPLPDAPKLEWPSLSLSGESEPVSVETEDVTEESHTDLPRPEDVPVGEAWLVLSEGRRAIGYRNDPGDRIPWCITYQGCMEFDYCYDSDITLVSRLVPEDKP